MMEIGAHRDAEFAGLRRLARWFADEALPGWITRGFDRHAGQFVEALDLAGTAIADPALRVRSAARQIHAVADAVRLGIGGAGHLALAEAAFDHLHAAAWHGEGAGGYGRVIDRRARTMTDGTRDLYDNACVLLAIASLLRVTGRQRYRQEAERLLAAIDDLLGTATGGWAEDERGTLPRRQNPHMHMFEALLALFAATGAPEHRRRLDAVHALFRARFFDDGRCVLREFFGPEWQIDARFGSDRLEPGHMCEWVALLGRYARLTGEDVGAAPERLLSTALRIGRGGGALLVDEVDERGAVLQPSRRLWPQAELVKAWLARFAATGEAESLRAADSVATEMQDLYLAHTPRGTWRDQFDLNGAMLAKTIPSSSLYHLGTVVAACLDPGPGSAGG